MGVTSGTATGIFPYTCQQVFDFVTDPDQWRKFYTGAGDIVCDLKAPLKLGDTWVEKAKLPEQTYYIKWISMAYVSPWKWTFIQEGNIGATDEQVSNGHPGIFEIVYTLDKIELEVDGKTVEGCLFKRTSSIDQPHKGTVPRDLLASASRVGGGEAYFAAVLKEMKKIHG